MTTPAAAARRQWTLDRLTELLVGWGTPLEHAEPRAAAVLDLIADAGYALPAALDDVPPPPGTSTPAGRTRARVLFAHHRVADQVDVDDPGTVRRACCACRAWHGPWRPGHLEVEPDHSQHLAAMLVVAGVATPDEQHRARPQRPADKINGREGETTPGSAPTSAQDD
jgi:hypothetical protein